MVENRSRQLWIYSQAGVFRFCAEDRWDRTYAMMVGSGWEQPSSTETMWLESRLLPYKPGSFFTAEDALSFAEALEGLPTQSRSEVSAELQSHIEGLVKLFRTGPIFICPDPPHKTIDTDSYEVVHVYLCPPCGFMHHGNWYFSTLEARPEDAGTTVESILKYKYCPLCSSKEVRTVAFVLPQLDPDELPDLKG